MIRKLKLLCVSVGMFLPIAPLFAHEDLPAVTNQDYRALCGECHFAHQGQWMPARSWRYFLTSKGLNDHFGVKVDKKDYDLQAVYQYLSDNESAKSDAKVIMRLQKKYDDKTIPVQITRNAHYEKIHRKIFNEEQKFVFDNPKVKYQGDCVACHKDAYKGDFSERTVEIPGFTKDDWD